MKMLFLDESGDHNLDPKKLNPIYPIFVLGGVIVDRAYAREVIEPALRQFKRQHFGREDVLLHTVEMGRGRRDYAFLADPRLRGSFYADLNDMLQRLDYRVIACVVRKALFAATVQDDAVDPYMFALEQLVERFCEDIGDELDAGFICAEKRNPGLDRNLMNAWDALSQDKGTRSSLAREIDRKIVDLSLKDKKHNIAGLQLADLVITPIGRFVAGKAPTANEVRWEVVQSKLRRVEGNYEEVGLMIRP